MKGNLAIMPSASYFQAKKTLIMTAAAVLSAAMLAISMLTSVAAASGIVQVTSNIADVPGGASLVLTVGTQNDGDVYELEVDHSLQSVLPEFSVYANESNPYGTSRANFEAMGVTVSYSAAANQWVIDFGDEVTDDIRDNGGDVRFYFVLRDADDNILWGSMSPTSPENTFNFNLVEGTGDELVPEPSDDIVEDEEDDVVIPGVPNTSVAR